MSDEREIVVEGRPATPGAGWTLAWQDLEHGVAQLRRGDERHLVVLEGGPTEWVATIAGRRMAVTARGHRERLLAESQLVGAAHHGPSDVLASLPGLVVRVLVDPGDAVAAGEPLITLEAMKMQNEIRAPRDGRVSEVAVAAGQAIAGGTLLVRLVDLDS
jgi:biotin carboxyl carrier protein